MTAPRLTLPLTPAEARALRRACAPVMANGNGPLHRTFPHHAQRAAALRAWRRLCHLTERR